MSAPELRRMQILKISSAPAEAPTDVKRVGDSGAGGFRDGNGCFRIPKLWGFRGSDGWCGDPSISGLLGARCEIALPVN